MPTYRVIVIGAGIAGLAAAHRCLELARERGLEVELRLLDAADRPGGVIRTLRRDGFLLELGPDAMITDRPWGVELVRRLGLQDRLIPTRSEHRRSFVAREGRLIPVPEGFQVLAPSRLGPWLRSPLLSWPGKLRMACDLLIPPRRDDGDESLGAFVLRRLGREALERIAQPMVAGIYGGDPMTLSLEATLARFRELERRHGSILRGLLAAARRNRQTDGASGARYGLFVSFRDGMQTLVDVLAERLPAGCFRPRTTVERLVRRAEGWEAIPREGSPIPADAVIVAVPAWRAAALLAQVDPALAAELQEIPYASCATMSRVYRRAAIPHPLDGFGFVVPARGSGLGERPAMLGCTFAHVKWEGRAPDGFAVLRAFVGEAGLEGRDGTALEAAVRGELRTLLGIEAEPEFTVTWRGERCMPQYRVGHLERVERIERAVGAWPGLALAGNAYRGVGIPDCIRSGEQAAERVLQGAPQVSGAGAARVA